MTAPENPPMEIPTKIGRYEILAELGRGAMGTVYRAKDPAMDRVVALKTIISVVLASEQGTEFRERFYREARAAGALAHPGIVPVFDVGEHEGMPFLVMEFVTGRTLADTAKQGERLSLDRVCEIGQKIAEALGYAHQHGVVHRDIKPANILLTSRETYGIERPKITDFGVAKLAEGQTTLTGQMVGTPAFMPPEQFTGAPIDRPSGHFFAGRGPLLDGDGRAAVSRGEHDGGVVQSGAHGPGAAAKAESVGAGETRERHSEMPGEKPRGAIPERRRTGTRASTRCGRETRASCKAPHPLERLRKAIPMQR